MTDTNQLYEQSVILRNDMRSWYNAQDYTSNPSLSEIATTLHFSETTWKVEPMLLILETAEELGSDAPDDCPICLSRYSLMESMTTNCGHMFCHNCTCRHLDSTNCRVEPKCPLCRSEIRTLEVKDVDYIAEIEAKYM